MSVLPGEPEAGWPAPPVAQGPARSPSATEHEKKQKLETDAMFRLEHGEADRGTLRKAVPTLSHLQEAQSAWKDDFALNSLLRRRFRVSAPRPGTTLIPASWHRQAFCPLSLGLPIRHVAPAPGKNGPAVSRFAEWRPAPHTRS